MTQKKFFKYGHVIYRWKRILMLISDFKEFFQKYNFWARRRGSKAQINAVLLTNIFSVAHTKYKYTKENLTNCVCFADIKFT